ncbi:hypothetical protein COK50_08340 [Bacillus thuringiensis]|nr:hypothetical protein CN420_19925 [Bacillus thuringiensis]PFS77217.1 hypothetical protein COK50_08340 [Bacillus thuringiensis]
MLSFSDLKGKRSCNRYGFSLQILQNATKLFVTVFITTFVTAYANKLVKGSNQRKRATSTSAKRNKCNSKRK